MTDSTVGTKTVEFDGTIENAFGLALETAVPYEGTYVHILDNASIPSDEQPSAEDILALVNNRRKANARQSAMNKALSDAGIEKPTLKDSVDLQIATLVKALVASGKYDKDGATKQAKAMLGIA